MIRRSDSIEMIQVASIKLKVIWYVTFMETNVGFEFTGLSTSDSTFVSPESLPGISPSSGISVESARSA